MDEEQERHGLKQNPMYIWYMILEQVVPTAVFLTHGIFIYPVYIASAGVCRSDWFVVTRCCKRVCSSSCLNNSYGNGFCQTKSEDCSSLLLFNRHHRRRGRCRCQALSVRALLRVLHATRQFYDLARLFPLPPPLLE